METIKKQNKMIETKVKEESSEIEYPSIGVTDDGLIVLFSEFEKGTILRVGGTDDEIGYYSKGWKMDRFKPLKGEITLKNK